MTHAKVDSCRCHRFKLFKGSKSCLQAWLCGWRARLAHAKTKTHAHVYTYMRNELAHVITYTLWMTWWQNIFHNVSTRPIEYTHSTISCSIRPFNLMIGKPHIPTSMSTSGHRSMRHTHVGITKCGRSKHKLQSNQRKHCKCGIDTSMHESKKWSSKSKFESRNLNLKMGVFGI